MSIFVGHFGFLNFYLGGRGGRSKFVISDFVNSRVPSPEPKFSRYIASWEDGARRAPGARRTGRPNMMVQSTESNLLWMDFGTREFTRSLIANLKLATPI